MEIDTVQTTASPMVFVTREASMEPSEISAAIGAAFDVLGQFIDTTGIQPAGPPLALYRNMRDGQMDIDVGIPVAEADLAKAEGEVRTGETPACTALKTTHRGPYVNLRDTYAGVIDHLKAEGLPHPSFAWEVYINDPETTPEDDLVTEIYMPAQA